MRAPKCNNALLNRGLPKWPQMLVSGAPVDATLAKEIIRRTDRFLLSGSGGNDHNWNRQMAARLRMPHHRDYAALGQRTPQDLLAINELTDQWLTHWGAIVTEYVRNDWLSCSFIGGPHGWCWPDGRISYVDNVGKWPSVENIVNDWSALAEAFPSLILAATLMDGESCEDNKPLVTILVSAGKVTLVEGSLQHHARFPPMDRRTLDEDASKALTLSPHLYEHGPIPDDWYREWEALAEQW